MPFIDFSNPLSVIALSNIDGSFLPNLLYKVVWKADSFMILLFFLLAACDVAAVGSVQVMYFLLFGKTLCDSGFIKRLHLLLHSHNFFLPFFFFLNKK